MERHEETFNVDTINVVRRSRNGVELELLGTQSYRDGEYTNERNASKTITVSKERAEKIRDDLDEIL